MTEERVKIEPGVGERIKVLRRLAFMTRKRLCESALVDMSEEDVTALEDGRTTHISFRNAKHLSEVLMVSTSIHPNMLLWAPGIELEHFVSRSITSHAGIDTSQFTDWLAGMDD